MEHVIRNDMFATVHFPHYYSRIYLSRAELNHYITHIKNEYAITIELKVQPVIAKRR